MRLLLNIIPLFIACLVVANADDEDNHGKNPRKLIEEMVESVGDYDKLKSLNDVQYTYTVRDNASGKEDVSVERYIFDGELSWAKYVKRESHVFPELEGEVLQGYNGKESWITVNGNRLEDPQARKLADFSRKTNFYWFTMMQKLVDPGLSYSYEGTQNVNGINYDLVKITFAEGVGDASDTYLLYINPRSHLVDQFLFTVKDFGITDPFIMRVEYDEIDGVRLPVNRKYSKSNWNGEVLEEAWNDEIMSDIKFNNGFKKSDFDKPQ